MKHMNDANTMRVGYEHIGAMPTAVPMPDEWSGYIAYKNYVNATAGASITADWTMRDVNALGALVAELDALACPV